MAEVLLGFYSLKHYIPATVSSSSIPPSSYPCVPSPPQTQKDRIKGIKVGRNEKERSPTS